MSVARNYVIEDDRIVALSDYLALEERCRQLEDERDRERTDRIAAQEKLSAVAAIIQNPELTWKQRAARTAVALAIQAQRPEPDPNSPFKVNLGEVAKYAGLIPRTTTGEIDESKRAYSAGRKSAGQIIKELAHAGAIAHREELHDRDATGKIIASHIVLQIVGDHSDVLRAVKMTPGGRVLQRPRGAVPTCPNCGPDTPILIRTSAKCVCTDCGTILATSPPRDKVITSRPDMLPASPPACPPVTDFKSLETIETKNTQGTSDFADFQRLEIGYECEPRWLPPIVDNMPSLLAERSQWMVWAPEKRDKGWNKAPRSPFTRRKASKKDSKHFGTLSEAVAQVGVDGIVGVGFVVTSDDPFSFVDLDHCRDPRTGELTSWAASIIGDLNSYTEVSPSGTGIRIVVAGTLPPAGRKRGPIEMYEADAFLTLTGHRVEGAPKEVAERQAELLRLHNRVFPPPKPQKPRKPGPGNMESRTDQSVLLRACSAKNGPEFQRLWDGDSGRYNGDTSSGDLALCGHLAYWTNDNAPQIDRLFRQSGRMREKWDAVHASTGETYGELTVRKALKHAR